MTRALSILAACLVSLGLAVGADTDDEAVARGKAVFFDTQEDEYPSCAHCHNLVPEKDEVEKAKHLGPGGTLCGAAVRAGWRNMNTYKDVADAAQWCAKGFQERKGGLKAQERSDLIAFLKTHAPGGPLPKRKVQKRPRLMKDVAGGIAKTGKKLVARYCAGCHHDGLDAISFELKANKKKKDLVLRKVRGYDTKRKFKPRSGTMGYYTTDRLTDEDLRHIIAHTGR